MNRVTLRSCLLLLASAGCTRITDIPDTPGGNPVVPSVTMYPFPNDFYLAADAGTVTGYRVAIPAEALPEPLVPEDFSDADGFSRVAPIVTLLPGGVDPATLPDAADAGATTSPDASVLLVRADTLEPWPALVEVDSQAPSAARQTLILRPHRAMDPDATYVVVLRDGVRDPDGNPHTPSEAFRALRDGIRTDSDAVEAQRDAYDVVNATIDALGLDRDEVVQAWSFHTRSRENVTRAVLSMHDAMDRATLRYELDSTADDGDNTLFRGTFTAPMFLTDDDRLVLDGDDRAIQQGEAEFPFLVSVPHVVTEPRPVIVFGHGFFASLDESTWSSLQHSLDQWQMSAVTTNFLGFNEDDQVETFARIGQSIANLDQVVAQQLQSQANFTALGRLVVEQLASDVSVDHDGTFAPLDTDRLSYMGISNGGTQGASIMAASPFFDRGALVVGGGGWAHMVQRAVQWNTMSGILTQRYADTTELQLVLSLAQQLFDRVDSLNYADRLVRDRFDGRTDVSVTMHAAVGDAQVANLVTEWVARSAGVPLVTPAPYDVWGLDTVTAEPPGVTGLSALLLYDENYPALPEGNVAPDDDNGAHETIRYLEAYLDQMGAYLETGATVQVCDGACDPD